MDQGVLAEAIIWIVLFLVVCGPIHEFAHAFAAWRLGDGTAKAFGRLTLDPFAHFDPVGGSLLIVSVILGALGGFPVGFGWAKPTPVNPYNLRGRYANAIVAAAGPLSNLALAAVFAIAFRALWAMGYRDVGNQSIEAMVQLILFIGVSLNVVLMLFNLIPVPPLDGSRVVLDLLSPRTAREVGAFMDQYGFFLLIAVIFLAGRIISPFFFPIVNFLVGVQ